MSLLGLERMELVEAPGLGGDVTRDRSSDPTGTYRYLMLSYASNKKVQKKNEDVRKK